MVNITQDDLLRYLYNETSPEKTALIRQLIETDTDLQESLRVLKSAKTKLEKIELISPDARSVENIFNYSERGVEELHPGK